MEALWGWFCMVTLCYKRAHTHINKRDLKIHDEWLPSTNIIHTDEGTRKSDLWKLYRDDLTWSPHLMRGHIHSYTNRAPKFMISGSPAHIWYMLVREHERVIYGTCTGMVWHGHPTHERAHPQLHKQGPKIHDKWLPSTHMIHRGEKTWSSDLSEVLSCVCMVCPHDLHLRQLVPSYVPDKIRGGSFPTIMWVYESIGAHFGLGLIALYRLPYGGPPPTHAELVTYQFINSHSSWDLM
jgi:hypothetical protein